MNLHSVSCREFLVGSLAGYTRLLSISLIFAFALCVPGLAPVETADITILPPDDNAYLTPHRAGGVIEAVARALDFLVSDLEAFLAGRELAHGIDEEAARSSNWKFGR